MYMCDIYAGCARSIGYAAVYLHPALLCVCSIFCKRVRRHDLSAIKQYSLLLRARLLYFKSAAQLEIWCSELAWSMKSRPSFA